MIFKSLHKVAKSVHLSGCIGQEELAGSENCVVFLWLAALAT